MSSEPQYYNAKIFRIYIAFLREKYAWNDEKINDLFQRLGSDQSILDMEDNWFDQAFADDFNNMVVRLTGDKDIAYKVGRYSIDDTAKGITGRIVSGLLSPSIAYRSIDRIAHQYSHAAHVELVHMRGTTAIIRSQVSPGVNEKEYQCRNRLGMLESVPTLYGLPSAVVEHPACIHHGDNYCEYIVNWIEPKTRYTPYISLGVFIVSALIAYLLGENPALSGLIGAGFGSGTYALLHYRADKRLRTALKDQIEALRISTATIERRHQESLLVNEINNLVSRMRPVTEICAVAADAIHTKMGYDRISIFLYDRFQAKLITAALAGVPPDQISLLKQAEFHVEPDNENGLLVNVVNTNTATFVKDVENELGRLSERSKALARDLSVKSFIAVPISFENTVFGILAVDNVNPSHPLSANDLDLLKNVVKPLAVSISNAMMYEEVRQSKEALEQRVIERTAELQTARDEAIRANNAKSQFLANMSHELRTPLNSILGYASLIRYQASEQELEQFTSDADKITVAGQHLLSMINQVLDLSKIEAGKMELHLEELDLDSLIKSVTTIADPLAKKNQNKFVVIIGENIGPICTDSTKLQQVIINLLSNACKFTHNGEITLKIDKERESLVIIVSDTGIGIPEDKISDLFQDFVQVDSSTTKQYGGTGLGLALCKRFVEMMGGQIKLESKINVGSTFTIHIPYKY